MKPYISTTNTERSRRTSTVMALTGVIALSAAALAPLAGPAGPAAARTTFADSAFEQVWMRSDLPVEDRMAARSWTWGPEPYYAAYEPYAEGPAGQHLVTYLDKSRMEINNPNGDRNSQWYVTNGLLVVDMVAGQIQVGDKMFAPATPANIPVAGDANSLNAPTYASLARVASLHGDNRSPNRTGQQVREGLGRTGGVSILDNLAGHTRYAVYEPTLGHNIPEVFWSFLNQRGVVYENGRYVEGPVFDWLFAMGYPITEPYWIEISVGGQSRWVLMQAFQRRILTYSPGNPEGWKVEMGNVGRAYFDWRYKGQAVQPTPVPTKTATPKPQTQAAINISPVAGDTNTHITVTGGGFAANARVTIRVEHGATGYVRDLTTVSANSTGAFSVKVKLPADVSGFSEVAIAATASGTLVRAPQTFKLQYANAAINVSPGAVQNGGAVRVIGAGFPARQDVRIGMFGDNGGVDWRTSVKAGDTGSFDVRFNIGTRPVGSTFSVVAVSANGVKATSGKIVVTAAPTPTPVPAPSVSVAPNGLAVGQMAVVTGNRWPAGTQILIGLARPGQAVSEWVTNGTADAQGNFSAGFILGERWRGAGQVELKAVVNNAAKSPRATTLLTVLTTGARVIPGGMPMTVSTLAFGNNAVTIKARGHGWAAGKLVNVGVISGDGTVNVTLQGVTVRADGTWEAQMTASAPWAGRRDLGVRAVTADNTQLSVRYLPTTEMGRTSGSTYTATGYNWPAMARVAVVLTLDGQPEQTLAAVTTAQDGSFRVSVDLQRLPSTNGNDIVIRAIDGDYEAIFDF